MKKIQGIPDGYELDRIDIPSYRELYIDRDGKVHQCFDSPFMHNRSVFPIIKHIKETND